MAPVTYNDYLRIDQLLSLQVPRSDPAEHDETLFIIIHQVYELWFKQILHEGLQLRRCFDVDDAPKARAALRRILTIFKTLVAQIDVLETMTPLSFLSFRARLDSASGFQSGQFRMMEFFLGRRDRKYVEMHEEGTEARATLERLATSRSLYDTFLHYLARAGHAIPQSVLERDVSQEYRADEAVQAALVKLHREDPINAQLCEYLLDLDEGIQEWRYRHVKMVQRTIGTKKGTGGTGVDYLRATLDISFFPDLWAIRSQF